MRVFSVCFCVSFLYKKYVKLNYKSQTGSRQEELKGTVSRFIHHYGFICVKAAADKKLNGDYFYSIADVVPESKGAVSVHSQVSFRVQKAPNPDGKTSAEKNGKAVDVRLVETNA